MALVERLLRSVDDPDHAAATPVLGAGHEELFDWMDDQVFAIELRLGVRVVRLAHSHSRVDENIEHDYWAEPQASVSPDFICILFTSNWGHSDTGEVEMYLIELSQGWSDQIP